MDKLVIGGLENTKDFYNAVIKEVGTLDSDAIRAEVVDAAMELVKDKNVGAILLECSVLPPYGDAVQRATGLPVFDFLTMIDFVRSSVVKKSFPDSY